MEPPNAESKSQKRLLGLSLGALGVVFGDIGTSPLYAVRECFHGPHAMEPIRANVLGVLSLIFWALIIIITIKYLVMIMRADNDGEGGILALMALVVPSRAARATVLGVITVLAGLFGAALLYGDGVITPAISVLSAVEGLEVAAPALDKFVIPITIGILVGLFALQRRGTEGVGFLFGPITLVWFVVLAAMGVRHLVVEPGVLAALNPVLGARFLIENGGHGFVILGIVFLVVTGGEALYADMGHFGRFPIRLAWFCVVLPALLLNYFGQGALLLTTPSVASNPFFKMAPVWGLYPLLILSTAATVVASQAVISGTFSLTMQAIHLGYLPRMEVLHTSEQERGQIYVPLVNWGLLMATVLVVLGFRTSSNLAAAYGVAVTTTMVITSLLAFLAMRRVWKWSLPLALGITVLFLIADVSFFGANILKVVDGGWLPLLIAAVILVVMSTWRRGREILADRLAEGSVSFEELFQKLADGKPARVTGTAVYMCSNPNKVPPALIRNLQHNGVLHERNVVFSVAVESIPYVKPQRRVRWEEIGPGFFRVIASYGFREQPNVIRALALCKAEGLDLTLHDTVFVLGRETVLATERPGMAIWRERLFALLARNAARATAYFGVPPESVLEIGAQIEL